MYPIERFLKSLKGYVRNKARPEGSIAEGYIVKECLTFMSMYLGGIETRFNRAARNYDGVEDEATGEFSVVTLKVRPFGPLSHGLTLSQKEIDTAHSFILNNCTEVEVYKSKHVEELNRANERDIQKCHQEQFRSWFKDHSKTVQRDKHFISVDSRSRWYQDDPFVLPNQVQQAFYVNDTKLDRNEHEDVVDVAFQPHESDGVVLVETEDDDLVYLARKDVEPEIIEEGVLNKINDDEDESADNEDDTLIQYCDDDDDDAHNLQNEIEDD
ncbi:UNVERIFIED_CONTAM: hypothetical protein Slati_1106800 [Sesamum latifolium]|uniref:DUF4218 domain-containing protein n=1 Tax=Sesamum latifolium TaxID=2727402 RepID=A0AAW2XAW9_9LAMI